MGSYFSELQSVQYDALLEELYNIRKICSHQFLRYTVGRLIEFVESNRESLATLP